MEPEPITPTIIVDSFPHRRPCSVSQTASYIHSGKPASGSLLPPQSNEIGIVFRDKGQNELTDPSRTLRLVRF